MNIRKFVVILFLYAGISFAQQVNIPLTIKDNGGSSQVLHFGLDPSATDGQDSALGEYPLPPLPPTGIFDARFIGDPNVSPPVLADGQLKDFRSGDSSFVGTKIHFIQYQVGTGNQITVSWNLPAGVTGRLQDVITGTLIDVQMDGTGSYVVTAPSIYNRLKMSINYFLAGIPAPILVTPANNSTSQELNTILTWRKTAYASVYKLDVSTSNIFTYVFYSDSTLTDTTKQLTGLQGLTTYYWRVRAKNTTAAVPISNYSEVRSFITVVQQFNIVTTSNPTVGGTTSGGGTYNSGTNATVTAIADTGYTFKNWTESDTIVSTSASYTFTVTGNRTLVANFIDITSVENESGLPINYSLAQNYPNPFNPSTNINYSLTTSGLVLIKIYDVLGREIKTLVNEYNTAGNYSISFDASRLASGVYFYRIQSGSFISTKKMLLLK